MDTPTQAEGSSPAIVNTPAAPAIAPAAVAPAVPVTPVAPAAPTGPQPTAQDIVGSLQGHERRAFVTGQKTYQEIIAARPPAKNAPAATPARVAPAVAATPAEPVATVPAEVTPPAEPVVPAVPAEPAAEEMPDRFRFKDPADQAIALIAKSKGVSLSQAAKLYENDPANRQATPAEPATPAAPAIDPSVQGYDKTLSELQAKLTKLSDDRKKAREDVESEKADSLSDEIADLRADIKLLQNERQGHIRNREEATAQSAVQQVTASRDRAIAQFPELKAEGSLHRLALDAYVNRALEDPKRANEWKDPTWPEKLTAEFARAHNLKTANAAPAAPAPSAPAAPAKPAAPATPVPSLRPKPQQVPGARLVNGADGSQPSASLPPTQADLQSAISRMTPAQRRQVLFPQKR